MLIGLRRWKAISLCVPGSFTGGDYGHMGNRRPSTDRPLVNALKRTQNVDYFDIHTDFNPLHFRMRHTPGDPDCHDCHVPGAEA